MIEEPIVDTYFLYILDGLDVGFHDFVTYMLLRSNINDINKLHPFLLLYEKHNKQYDMLEMSLVEENVVKINNINLINGTNLDKRSNDTR